MDYYEIGQRIRKARRAVGLSQEALAEKVNISVTHMSHIETGNTKLSLPVFVKIASALDIRTDDLLYDSSTAAKSTSMEEIASVLSRCSSTQAKIIADIVKSLKISMDKYS